MSIVTDVIAELNAEREKIWLECPTEISNMGKGIIPRRTGAHGQYLSTLMFAEGEARTLSDELLWGIIEVSETNTLDLTTLQLLMKQIVGYKAAFFDFVGMPEAGALVGRYVEATQAAESMDEFLDVTRAAISYVNKVHMWVDAVFPWGVTNGFKRVDA
ncbi:MAG: Shikimate dehydrogenase substrate binding protein [Frondihabitans sp.]|nr:Shikimate dehydrogenase substrate binding protein [Frondihabitans sp.]